MENKTLFGVLCILFNSYGVPLFLQGKTKAGILRIVYAIISFGIIGIINAIKGIILGIKVLQMTDEEFEACKATISDGIPKE